ncbi:hypothetical protein BH10PSE17_BH10PSE17_29060 [soil metagenome]
MHTIEIQAVAPEAVAQEADQTSLITQLLDLQLAFVGGGTGCVIFD